MIQFLAEKKGLKRNLKESNYVSDVQDGPKLLDETTEGARIIYTTK